MGIQNPSACLGSNKKIGGKSKGKGPKLPEMLDKDHAHTTQQGLRQGSALINSFVPVSYLVDGPMLPMDAFGDENLS
jgi:hypothetical protein